MIIGAGGVGRVVAHKCAEVRDIFGEIVIASKTLEKCQNINNEIGGVAKTEQVDANDSKQVVALLKKHKSDIVINVALPYQVFSIMNACLEANVHYLDTSNDETVETIKYSYKEQWEYKDRFEKKGLTAILGSGFDPGVTGVFCSHALKHHFDSIEYIDIFDCNGGDHGMPFATNFNAEVNIREISQPGFYWEKDQWIKTKSMEIHFPWDYPEIGVRESYLLYHEELESLAKNLGSQGLKRIRFFMTFSEEYLTHLRVLQNVGMTDIVPVEYKGTKVVPLDFLKQLLPDPASLAKNYKGNTCIGNVIEGIKDGKRKKLYIYNICSHEESYKTTNSQAVSFTAGVPAMIGAMLVLRGDWKKPGVYNVEDLNPDPYMDALNTYGLAWTEKWL